MKAATLVLLALSVLIAVVPQVANCQHEGKALTLADGRQVPMKCYWTAQSALSTSIPLLGLAAALALSRRKETRRALLALGTVLGGVVILLPNTLIGVCQHPGAICHWLMRPALTFLGTLVVATSMAGLAISMRQRDLAAPARAHESTP